MLVKKYSYDGVLNFFMSSDSVPASPSIILHDYNPVLDGAKEKYYNNIINLSHGDRLIVYDNRHDIIFDEKICRHFNFTGYLKFELTFVPFFFDERELNNWISFFDRKLEATIIKYYL